MRSTMMQGYSRRFGREIKGHIFNAMLFGLLPSIATPIASRLLFSKPDELKSIALAAIVVWGIVVFFYSLVQACRIGMALIQERSSELEKLRAIVAQKAPSWCDEMADADVKNIFSRVTAVRWKPRCIFTDKNNYIEFEITFVNASVFELKSPKLHGIAQFDRHPLPDPQLDKAFDLARGAKTWMKIRQFVSQEIAKDMQQRINRDGVTANLDFTKLGITFQVEFPGRQPWEWTWTGLDGISVKEITTF